MKFFIFLFFCKLFSQNTKEQKELLLFTRSTKHKIEFIAKDFNLKDTLSTHIGIGFKKNEDEFVVYHVNTVSDSVSFLKTESYKKFTSLDDIIHSSIIKFNISENEREFFFNVISEYKNSIISFDNNFDLNNGDNNLYCSEFVNAVLNRSLNNFYCKPSVIELNSFYKNIFKKDSFKYYPVDFYCIDNRFQKIEETFY
jgi:hypothetical protein